MIRSIREPRFDCTVKGIIGHSLGITKACGQRMEYKQLPWMVRVIG
jgi:hypothetical protein